MRRRGTQIAESVVRNQPSGRRDPVRIPAGSPGRYSAQSGLANERHGGLLPPEHHACVPPGSAAGRSCRDPGTATPVPDRTTAQHAAIFTAWRLSVPDLKALNDEIDTQWKGYPQAPTSVLCLAERPAESCLRMTHFLDRGNWDQPRQMIEPHTPAGSIRWTAPGRETGWRCQVACRPTLPLDRGVAVNRVWQAMFGTGLVETPEDFGTRAPLPEYRELLDTLAVDFMQHGWSQKHLIRTIVTSAVYQQSSTVTPVLLERDPRNRWLARGPRLPCRSRGRA